MLYPLYGFQNIVARLRQSKDFLNPLSWLAFNYTGLTKNSSHVINEFYLLSRISSQYQMAARTLVARILWKKKITNTSPEYLTPSPGDPPAIFRSCLLARVWVTNFFQVVGPMRVYIKRPEGDGSVPETAASGWN